MKRIVLLVIATFTMIGANAQIGELSLRAQGKTLAPASFRTFYINGDTSSILVEQNASLINMRYELIRMDMDQKESARARYRRELNRIYLDGFDNPDGVDLLVEEFDKNGTRLKVTREHRDAATLEVQGEPVVLGELSGTKKDKMGFLWANSPNKQLTAGVYVMQREGEGAEATVKLMNRKYEEYWQMTTRLHVLSFIRVTDSGEVIIGGWRQQKESSEASFEIIALDGEKDYTYHFEVNEGRFMELRFANYAKGKIYIFGMLREEGNKGNGSQADRLMSICYDTKTKHLTEDVHKLTPVEVNRLYNVSDNARTKSTVRFLQIDATTGSPDGGASVVLSQQWIEHYQKSPDRTCKQGLLVATVDNDGHFDHILARRMNNNITSIYENLLNVSLNRAKNGTLLFYVEHPSTAEKSETSCVKTFYPGMKKGTLTVVYIPDSGEPEVQHINIGKMAPFITPKTLGDGKYLFFLRGRTKAQLGIFSLNSNLK